MTIGIIYIPHSQQRYDTLDDYFIKDDDIQVRISETGNELANKALTIHAITELLWVIQNNVLFKSIDEWDLNHEDSNDPGSVPGCPYGIGHKLALDAEYAFVKTHGMSIDDYENILDEVIKEKNS